LCPYCHCGAVGGCHGAVEPVTTITGTQMTAMPKGSGSMTSTPATLP
jgi:hypothetical protein